MYAVACDDWFISTRRNSQLIYFIEYGPLWLLALINKEAWTIVRTAFRSCYIICLIYLVFPVLVQNYFWSCTDCSMHISFDINLVRTILATMSLSWRFSVHYFHTIETCLMLQGKINNSSNNSWEWTAEYFQNINDMVTRSESSS